jgi:hypothetical protein
MCRRVEVQCAVSPPQIRSAICGILRRRDRVIGVPSPFQQRELLVLGAKQVSLRRVRTEFYQADLHDRGALEPLRLDQERDRGVIAALLERALVVAFEQEAGYWRLFDSTRRWYREEPVTTVNGVQVIPRMSFATVSLGEEGVGVAFDSGYLYRTEMTVAEFFDSRIGRGERQERIRRFERLRTRGERRKGTLLYDTRHDALSVCYFERFEEGVTCDATGPIQGKGSLYEYCQDKHPQADVQPGDSVACVSFRSKGLPHPVLVPAKMLRLRVMADKDQSVRGLGQFKTSPPTSRRDAALRAWEICGESAARAVGVRFEEQLWRPARHELLPGAPLEFGKGRTVNAPDRADVQEYQRYFRQRLEKLRDGGLYYYDEAMERKLHLVTPTIGNGWTEELQQAFVTDFSASIKDITGLQFRVTTVREDDPDRIVEVLWESHPGTTVIVFDDRAADNAAYFLLAHGLPGWKLKRLTRRQVQDKWQARSRGRNAAETRKAEQRWKDMITLSVIDTLDQMGAVPWRLKGFPYDACLAIDVGEGRRYFAMSLLICRDERRSPAFLRLSRSWPKGDHQHEAINPEMLRDKVVQLLEGFPTSEFTPLQSLLVLRDGHQCSDEPRGIAQAIDRLKQKGKLVQGATVDVVDVHKKTVKNLRIWEPAGGGCENVLEGRAVYLDEGTALLCCTGAATLSRGATADPCMLVMREGADVRKAARAFFVLSQLNYSSCTFRDFLN